MWCIGCGSKKSKKIRIPGVQTAREAVKQNQLRLAGWCKTEHKLWSTTYHWVHQTGYAHIKKAPQTWQRKQLQTLHRKPTEGTRHIANLAFLRTWKGVPHWLFRGEVEPSRALLERSHDCLLLGLARPDRFPLKSSTTAHVSTVHVQPSNRIQRFPAYGFSMARFRATARLFGHWTATDCITATILSIAKLEKPSEQTGKVGALRIETGAAGTLGTGHEWFKWSLTIRGSSLCSLDFFALVRQWNLCQWSW